MRLRGIILFAAATICSQAASAQSYQFPSSGFLPYPAYVGLNATTSSQSLTLPVDSLGNALPPVVVYNEGSALVSVKQGASGVVATMLDNIIPALGGCSFTVGRGNTTLPTISLTGTNQIVVSDGYGLATGRWGAAAAEQCKRPVITNDGGSAITGATIPSGGAGLTGWESAIWYELDNRKTGLAVMAPG
ncbi:MAG: hypothetical protein ACLQFI_16820 [Methylocella sp.]